MAVQLRTPRRADEVLCWIDGCPMTARGLQQLHRFLDKSTTISNGLREVVTKQFPQYKHKLPPKRLHG